MPSLKKIDVMLARISQYEVLHHFGRKLHEALIRAGVKSRLLQGDEFHLIPAADPPDLTIGFNGVPRTQEGDMYSDLLQIPHLSILVDPPYHYPYLINSPYMIISVDDIGCSAFLNALHFKRHLFLPHAVEPELAPDEPSTRDYDIVLLATYIDYETRRGQWKNKYPLLMCKVMDDTIDMTFSSQDLPFIAAFNIALRDLREKQDLSGFEKININFVLQDLEYYVKGRDRVDLVRAIEGAKIDIFGGTIDKDANWKKQFSNKKNIQVHDPINFEQALQVMKQTKILLNPALKNKDGAHERVFTGIACGAAVITNTSSYLKEHFIENRELLFYDHPHLEDVNFCLEDLLNNETKRKEIVERAKARVSENETWDNRVGLILNVVPRFIRQIWHDNPVRIPH